MRKKKKNIINFEKYTKNIIDHKQDLPKWFDIDKKNIVNDSWFAITETTSITKHEYVKFNENFDNEKIINSTLIKIKPSKIQKDILDKWFISSTRMYNETLKYIRDNFPP